MEPKQENTAHQLRVMEFMRRAGRDVPMRPTVPTAEIRLLRAKLILEEALETIRALGVIVDTGSVSLAIENVTLVVVTDAIDLEEVADGCADLSVVNTGTLVACGLPDEPILRTVDESNLTKFDPPQCPDCGGNMMRLAGSKTWVCIGNSTHRIRPLEDGPYRRDDGKWIKPPYWKKPSFLGAIKGDSALL